MQNKNLRKIVLAISAFSFALILSEICLHFFHPIEYRKPPRRYPNNVQREFLHRPSSVSGLAYELVPSCTKYSRGILVKTNSWGMRDDEPRSKSDSSLHRIVVLGDSFTFGFGVLGEHTYPNVLEQLLNEGKDEDEFEVLNFGVGGYSTRDETLVLKQKAISWNPDLIIVGYHLNDPEIDPTQPLHSHYQQTRWWQYSHLLRLIAEAKFFWDIKKIGEGDYFRYLHSPQQPKWQGVIEAFDEISNVAAKRKVPVLLLIFPITANRPWTYYPYRDLHQQVKSTANERGINVIDLYKEFSRYPPNTLMVNPKDGHPSKFAHGLVANTIYQWILANKERIYAF